MRIRKRKPIGKKTIKYIEKLYEAYSRKLFCIAKMCIRDSLQRGFDQILHDVAIGNYPVIFGLDRSGLVGADGETHQGIFDIPYLSIIPNMTVMAPINGRELSEMLKHTLHHAKGPTAIKRCV